MLNSDLEGENYAHNLDMVPFVRREFLGCDVVYDDDDEILKKTKKSKK